MVNVEDAVIARLVRDNEHFELLVDCEKAMQYRKGEADLNEVLVVEEIFKNARTGDKQSEEQLKKTFQTTSLQQIADNILKKGEIQLTADYRKKQAEGKRKKVVAFISRNAIDPRTNTPIPLTRVELAMEETKTHVDPNKSVEEQIDKIVDELRPVLPISFEKKGYTITVPAKSAGKAFSKIMRYGQPKEQKWLADGGFYCKMSIPAGIAEEFINDLNKLTGGEIMIKEE
ncbi:MAG: ribosome assembly factor SBDS [Nanoarchaeota archaeon]|nr:ribosome assembly factor SBDS [Nanoarchaeota archaeon]